MGGWPSALKGNEQLLGAHRAAGRGRAGTSGIRQCLWLPHGQSSVASLPRQQGARWCLTSTSAPQGCLWAGCGHERIHQSFAAWCTLWKDQWGGIFAAASGLCYRLCLAAHVGNVGCYLDDRLPALLVTEARGLPLQRRAQHALLCSSVPPPVCWGLCLQMWGWQLLCEPS